MSPTIEHSVNRFSALKWIMMGWLVMDPSMRDLIVAPAVAQNQYVEVRNGNVYVQVGATTAYRELVQDFAGLGLNRVVVGTSGSRPDQIEIVQPEIHEGGFSLAESTALDMLVSADRNPDRYAGLNPLAIKAILLAGARIEISGVSGFGQRDQLDALSGAGLTNRRRSLEIFASGRQVPGTAAESAMGWNRSIAYLGHPARYFFRIEDGGSWDFVAALASNPEVVQSGSHWISEMDPIAATLRVLRSDENGDGDEVVMESRGEGGVEYLSLNTLPAGRYILEVNPKGDGLSYGVAWHAQRHGTVLPEGGYDPVFLYRKGSVTELVEVGSRVQFSGTAFGALADLVRIEFFADGVRIGESNQPEFDFSWIADREGASGIYAVATDRYGNQVFSSVSTVEVIVSDDQGPVVRGPVISEDLSGVYLGGFSGQIGDGWIAVSVLPEGKASILGYSESAGFGFFGRDGVVDTDGRIVFPSIHYLGISGEATPGGTIHAAISDRVFSGKFNDGVTEVSARLSGDGGPMIDRAGFIELGILNRDSGCVLLVIDGDGEVRGLVCDDDALVGIIARIQDAETLSLELDGGRSLMLDLGAGDGQVSGVFAAANGVNEELMGIRDTAERRDRLANISTRGVVANGSGVLIAGFVVEGDAPKQVIIRAVGPTLKEFGITGYSEDPQLVVRRSMGVVSTNIAINDDWDGSGGLFRDLAERVGAFPLSAGQSDAAIVLSLEPGIYTAEMSDNGSGGLGLIEVYDADDLGGPSTDRISNISTRGMVRGGVHSLVGGFVVVGTVPKRILIRAVGPSLAKLGVVDPLEDATLMLDRQVDGVYSPILENRNWSENRNPALIREASAKVGAFPLEDGSKDAVIMALLKPGVYTATVNAPDRGEGIALLEVYEVGED